MVREAHSWELICCENFIFAFIRPFVDDLKIKGLSGMGDVDIEFLHLSNCIILKPSAVPIVVKINQL